MEMEETERVVCLRVVKWYLNRFFALLVAGMMSSNMDNRERGNNAINVVTPTALAAPLFERMPIVGICPRSSNRLLIWQSTAVELVTQHESSKLVEPQ